MTEKVFSDIFYEIGSLVSKKGAKYVLSKLRSISNDDFAQIEFERMLNFVSGHFKIGSYSITEKHNKSDKVYAARVVICHLLSTKTTITQVRMSKMLNKDTSQISKYVNSAKKLDERDPTQREIKNAIDKFQWQKR
tara:strand:+ start:1978 stop:2385 length:408 start_codon:yes stop_codon:yes gene_type:complete